MRDLFKRHFWIVGALTVLACSFFAAKIAGHVLEARFLTDANKAPKVVVMASAASTSSEPTAVEHDKNNEPLVKRNMFCSDCLPPPPPVATGPVSSDPSFVPPTSLPLRLLATSVGGDPQFSFATVLNTESNRQGAFWAGDAVPGGGAIKDVHYRYIDFENPAQGNRLERLMLFGLEGEAPPPPPVVAAVEPVPTGDEPPKDELQAAVDAGIKKIDDTHYEIDRALVDKVMANPMAMQKGARVVAAVKNGKPDGFKMYAIKPTSAYAKLGFTNGDTMHAINGFELTSIDKALQMYTQLKDATSLQVDITRRNKPVTLNYTIR